MRKGRCRRASRRAGEREPKPGLTKRFESASSVSLSPTSSLPRPSSTRATLGTHLPCSLDLYGSVRVAPSLSSSPPPPLSLAPPPPPSAIDTSRHYHRNLPGYGQQKQVILLSHLQRMARVNQLASMAATTSSRRTRTPHQVPPCHQAWTTSLVACWVDQQSLHLNHQQQAQEVPLTLHPKIRSNPSLADPPGAAREGTATARRGRMVTHHHHLVTLQLLPSSLPPSYSTSSTDFPPLTTPLRGKSPGKSSTLPSSRKDSSTSLPSSIGPKYE